MYIPKHVRIALLNAIKLSVNKKNMTIKRHVVSTLSRKIGSVKKFYNPVLPFMFVYRLTMTEFSLY
jgi:hypothetical protein